MRWRPVAPNGVSHLSTKEEFYKGMVIPKGSIIVQNTWGILHDPNLYAEPDKFNPVGRDGASCSKRPWLILYIYRQERFIKHEFGHKEDAPTVDFRGNIWFGAGRRICKASWLQEKWQCSLMILTL
jgi:cytochrome P450